MTRAMADILLNLGGIAFSVSELAQSVSVRRDQMPYAVAETSGGAAAASKAHPVLIEWQGTLHGKTAGARTQSLLDLAQLGADLLLRCGDSAISVRISQFDCDAARSHKIPYRLCCVLSQGPTDRDETAIIDDLVAVSRALKALADLVGALARQAAHDTAAPQITPPDKEDKP